MTEYIEFHIEKNKESMRFNLLSNNDKISVLKYGLEIYDSYKKQQSSAIISDKNNEIKKIIDNYEKSLKETNEKLIESETLIKTIKSNHTNALQEISEQIKEQQKIYWNNRLLQATNDLEKSRKDYQELHEKYKIILETNKNELLLLNNRIHDMSVDFQKTTQQQSEKIIQLTQKQSDLRNNSSKKGKSGEDWLKYELNRLFPSCTVEENTSKTSKSGDFFLIGKNINMIIETKNYTRNIPSKEVDKFHRDIQETHDKNINCGIFISQSTGIANIENFTLEIIHGIPIIYLTHFKDNPECIVIAFKFLKMIIDNNDLYNFDNQEINNKLKQFKKTYESAFKKRKKTIEKQYSDNIKQLDEDKDNFIKLFTLLKVESTNNKSTNSNIITII